MPNTLVSTTKQGEYHPLAFQGLLVYENHYQLTEIIRQRLGLPYVLLFAEPVVDSQRLLIDWYCAVQGNPVSLIQMPQEKQDAVRREIASMAEALQDLAQSLKQSPAQSLAGELLALATQYPDDAHIFLVGDQPVLTSWGFGPSTLGAQPQDLARVAQGLKPVRKSAPLTESAPAEITDFVAPAESAMPIMPVVKHKFNFWWLLPLLFLLLLLALLFTPLGPQLFTCIFPLPEVQEQKVPVEIEPIRLALLDRAALCERPAEITEPAPLVPVQEPVPAIEPLENSGVELEPEQEVPLVLPEDPTSDMGFLAGLWRCNVDLEDGAGKALAVEYFFDANGVGYVAIQSANEVCKATAFAQMEDKELVITTQDVVKCPSDAPYSGQEIRCVQAGDKTLCNGVNITDKTIAWDAKFSKKDVPLFQEKGTKWPKKGISNYPKK